jgi:hypothetical protein
MSGYFGALMRSSGMAIAARPPARTPIYPRVMEIDVERSAALPAPAAPTASALQPATVTPISVPPPSVEPARRSHAPDEHDRDTHARPVPEHAQTRATTDRLVDPLTPRTSRAVEPPQGDLGQAVVRAAMRWVAAETPHARTDAVTTDRQLASPDRGVDDVNTIAPPPVSRAHRLDVETPEPNATPARTISQEVKTSEPVVAHAVPMPLARLTPSLPTPVAPVARDEVVEVSIGAIHVRVDAPQVQTVARPSASPPAPARRATASQARSALSRRALRRI